MKRAWPWLAVFAAYLAIAVLVTLPAVLTSGTRLIGWTYGDAYETAHHMWWIRYALQTGQSPFFVSNMAYPAGIDGITLWSNPLHFFPGWLLTAALPLPAAYNVQVLGTLALNGLSLYAAMRSRTFGGLALLPAFAAGLVFMLYPTMQAHLGAGHGGLLVQWPLALAAWALLRLRECGGRRALALAAGACALTGAGHPLQPIYALAPLAAVLLAWLLLRHERAAAGRVLLAVLLGMGALLAYLAPTFAAVFGTPAIAEAGGSVRYSLDALAPFTPSFLHPLYGQLAYTRAVLGVNLDEGLAYVGAAALLLIAAGLRADRRARPWLALAALAFVLGLGPLLKLNDQPVTFIAERRVSFVTLPGALLAELPGLRVARTPGRFAFALALAVAIMAGYGAAWLHGRWRRAGRIALVAVLALIALDYQTFWPVPTAPGDIPAAVAALSARRDIRAVFDVPWRNLETAKAGLYLQTAHAHALLAGQVTRATPADPARLSLLEAALDPAALRDSGVDIVIVHRLQDDGTLAQRANERLGAPLYADERLLLFEVPPADSAPRYASADGPAAADSRTLYVYAPRALWLGLNIALEGEGSARLAVDGVPANQLAAPGESQLVVPLGAGYHTLTLSGEPACPPRPPAGLACRLRVQTFSAGPGEDAAPLRQDFSAPGGPPLRALTLENAFVPIVAYPGETLRIPLYWRFAVPVPEHWRRFVHLLAPDGTLAAQHDLAAGPAQAGEMLADFAAVTLPAGLAPGAYLVRAGWYQLPGLERACALQDGVCAGDSVALGTVVVRAR